MSEGGQWIGISLRMSLSLTITRAPSSCLSNGVGHAGGSIQIFNLVNCPYELTDNSYLTGLLRLLQGCRLQINAKVVHCETVFNWAIKVCVYTLSWTCYEGMVSKSLRANQAFGDAALNGFRPSPFERKTTATGCALSYPSLSSRKAHGHS